MRLGVGHLEPATIGPASLDAVAAEHKQVKIEFAWAPAPSMPPAEGMLEHLERGQESQCACFRIRARRHVQSDYRVEENGLIRHAHRARPEQPRHAADASARQGIKGADGTLERGARVADVGAQPDVSANSLAQLSPPQSASCRCCVRHMTESRLRRASVGRLRPRLGRGMGRVTVLIFHRPASAGEPELVRLLASVRDELAAKHAAAFREAGAGEVRFVYEWHEDLAFGEVLAKLAPTRGGVIVLSGGAVPLLNRRDARRLVEAAGADEPRALTNNRYSSDVCAVAQAQSVRKLPPLPTDNALPRWLEEHAGYSVTELRARERLGLDLDTPQDVALAALAPTAPAWLSQAARAADLAVPRMDELRALAQDPHAELLVFGRSGSATLRWLERSVRCRVRFLAEERGLRASTPLAIRGSGRANAIGKTPRATLGLLLDQRGPEALAQIVGELAGGAIIDSRVLLAHHRGADESSWPDPEDRFASDLHRAAEVKDPWLRQLTASAAGSRLPIVLGGHSLVGPGIPLLFRAT